MPVLVDLLADPACSRRAGQALVAVGAPAVGALCDQLTLKDVARQVKLQIPRLLRRIPLPETYERLRALAAVEDSHLRLRICAALSHLRQSLQLPPEPVAAVYAMIHAEVRETYGNLAGWEAARPLYSTPLLEEVFEFRRERACGGCCASSSCATIPSPWRWCGSALCDPARRANALEVLDTLLDAPLRPLVMPFLDDLPMRERLKKAGTLVPADAPAGRVPAPPLPAPQSLHRAPRARRPGPPGRSRRR